MPKQVSKAEVIKTINQSEPLEIQIEIVDRNETQSSKQSKVNRFINVTQGQLKDLRTVILIAIQLK